MMDVIMLAVLKYLTDGMTLRDVRSIVGKSLSTIRAHAEYLIADGFMTGLKSPKGYYLSRSYKLTEKGRKAVDRG